MTVSPQTYTVASPWVASSVAGIFETAFIDAGLMTSWYDSFTSGTVVNRVLQIVYDGAKTYGTTYYWFMFTSDGVYLHFSTGWNDITHVPTGTQYLDYYSTTTNAVSNHCRIISLSNTVTTTLTRYTSGVDSDFTWFVIKNGTTIQDIHISKAAPASFIDLDKVMYSWVGYASPQVAGTFNRGGAISFSHVPIVLRRHFVVNGSIGPSSTATGGFGGGGNLSTTSCIWFGDQYGTHRYYFSPVNSGSTTTNPPSGWGAIPLPLGFPTVNPAYSSTQIPVFSGLSLSLFSTSVLPSDFGIAPHYVNNNMSLYDKFIVSAGTNEWEIIDVANSGTADNTTVSTLFLARTT